MSQKNDRFICVLPWNHVFVANSGELYPCCMSQKNAISDENCGDSEFRFLPNNLVSKSKKLKKIRQEMLAGEIPNSCSGCKKVESLNMKSYRNHVNNLFKQTYEFIDSENVEHYLETEFIDFRFGNSCNLKCRMCNPSSSSKLNAEFKEFYDSDNFVIEESSSLIDLDWIVNCKSLKRLNLAGGEPFYIPEVHSFLEKLSQRSDAKKMTLTFHTNLAIFNESIFKIFERFQDVEVGVSIDGIGKLNDYIRHQSKWEKIIANIGSAKKYAKLHINITVQIYNIFSLDKLINYFETQLHVKPVIHILEHPNHLSVQSLPLSLKRLVTQKLEKLLVAFPKKLEIKSVIDYMNENDNSKNFAQFIKWTTFLDGKRSQSISEVVPELSEYFLE